MGLAAQGSILASQVGGGIGPGGATQVQDPTQQQSTGGGAMGGMLQGIGGGLVSNLVGAGMGLLLQGEQNRNQLNQQNKLDQLQLGYNEQAANYSQQLQYKTWLETNYPEQVEQMKQAGLNPDLMYAKGGPGGTTGAASASGVGSGTPGAGSGGAVTQAMGMQLQGQMMQAQIDNIQAQTKKTQVEATKEAGIDTTLEGAQATNTNTDTILKKSQTAAQGFANQLAEGTMGDQMKIVDLMAKKMQDDLWLLNNQVNVSDATLQTQKSQVMANYANTLLQNDNLKLDLKLTQEQTYAIGQELSQNYLKLTIDQQNANTASKAQHLQESINDVPESSRIPMQTFMNIAELFTLKGLAGAGQQTRTTIQGFGR